MVYYSAQTKGYCTPWSPSSSWLQHCRFPGPPGPSWGLGWANVTAPEGPRLMARKWPDNSAETCLSRVPARGSKDIQAVVILGFFILNLSLTSQRGCSPSLHWAQACKVEE